MSFLWNLKVRAQESARMAPRTARQVVSEDTARVVWDYLKRFRLSETARQAVSEDTARVVWDDLKRFRLSETARQVVSENTARVVWDDLKRFRLSQTTFAPTFQVVQNCLYTA